MKFAVHIAMFAAILAAVWSYMAMYQAPGNSGCRYLKSVPEHPTTLHCSRTP